MVNMLKSNKELLSLYYDELTYDMPYNLWLDIIHHFKGERESILDIGCGTGALTNRLMFKNIKGIDISKTMISVAQSKNPSIEYSVGDMLDFKMEEHFEMITATVDVMNYLNDKDDFTSALKNIYNHLEDNGRFIFDVHSVYKMNEDFMDMTYSDETDHLVYIWHAVSEEAPLTVTHDMTFFIKDSDGKYERHDEYYTQRTYTHKDIMDMIKEAGLVCEAAFSDFDVNNLINDLSDRNFYVVKKASQ